MRVTPRRSPKREAAAAVEFAVTLPLLVTLLLGIWEVGRIVHVKQIVSNAAREGARASSTGTNNFNDVQNIVSNYLTNAGLDATGVTVEITNITTNNGAAYDPTQATQLDEMRIYVSLPFDNVRWAFVDQLTDIREIRAQVEWRSMKDIPIDTSQFGGDQIPQVPLS